MTPTPERQKPRNRVRARLHEVIFEADTRAGRWFDLVLIWSILISVAAVMLDSVGSVRAAHGALLDGIEWFFTILFTIEYLLRLWCIGRPLRYATSFFGIVDVLAIAPTYLSLLLPGSEYLLVIRILRVLRIFRVLKLVQYIHEANAMAAALRASARKISVFFATVVTLVVIFGSVMYLVEGEENGFTSIPRSIYWAVVTMTTVGYGDISPNTAVGQAIAAVVMIIGFTIIAVPTGIVASEMTLQRGRRMTTQVCPECAAEGHDADARHCKRCGAKL
jgi:voltage-gated potassium channel